MPKENQKDEASPSTKIRLVLHAVDGVVPFLTPALLRKCFPVKTFGDRLWMGMAVKDTCIVPTFAPNVDESETKNKPRGYQFSATDVKIDHWMTPYTRVTVPTFDMVADAQKRQPHHAMNVEKMTTITASDQHVMMWTGNGRQSLTVQQYAASARALASQYTVPLYDEGSSSIHAKPKRWLDAQRRTREWSTDFSTHPGRGETKLVFPVLVNEQIWKSNLEERLQFFDSVDAEEEVGALLIGWSNLSPSLQQKSLETAALQRVGALLGVLSTQSLDQILLAAKSGANLIGSNLPQQWAEEKQAFLLDWKNPIAVDQDPKEPAQKRVKRGDGPESVDLDVNGCISLQPPGDEPERHPWYRDKSPLLPGCACHTCQTHSRAYVYHLVCAKEMLAEVLLFIHNLHHLLEVLRRMESNL